MLVTVTLGPDTPGTRSWGSFLEIPETFRVYFGRYNFLRIAKTKTFPGMKFCNNCVLSYLEIIVKGHLFSIGGSQFLKGLFGPEKLKGLSRNGPQTALRISLSVHLWHGKSIYFFWISVLGNTCFLCCFIFKPEYKLPVLSQKNTSLVKRRPSVPSAIFLSREKLWERGWNVPIIATSFPELFPRKKNGGREKALASASHVFILHPEILGVIN